MRCGRPPTEVIPTSAAVLLGFGRSTGDPGTRALIVLLADSVPANRLRVSRMLEGSGHRCVGVAGWSAALGELSRTPVDAVLLDIACEGARGVEAARRLRDRPPPLGQLPLLALSARRTPGEAEACGEAGFDALLVHPLQPDALEAALPRASARRPSRWIRRGVRRCATCSAPPCSRSATARR